MIALSAPKVRAEVSPTAAMLVDATFIIDGREVHPFAKAPWIGDPDVAAFSGHERVLGGEFVGVPFGSAGRPEGVVPEWVGLIPKLAPSPPHGSAGDLDWAIADQHPDRVRLTLAAPGGLALQRRIRLDENEPCIHLELEITAATDRRIAVGLHPILRLPEQPRVLSLDVPFTQGWTYPGVVPPGVGATRPWAVFTDLASAPGHDGDVDLSRLPLGGPIEDLVLLSGITGPVRAHYTDDHTVVTLDWDRAILPSLLMWISDRALVDPPWSGRYRGLGLEAVAAAFDLPNSVSTADTPLSRAGVCTSVELAAGVPLTIRSSVAVSSETPYV